MKNKIIFPFKLLLIILLIDACTDKNNYISISGTIEDPNHQIELEDVTVNLYCQKIESGAYSSNFQLVETTTSNQHGEFSFSQPVSYVPAYKLEFEKNNYFNFSEEFNSDIISNSEYFKRYEMYPEGFIKLHIENTFPNNTTDILIYNFSKPELNCNDCCNNTDHKYTGNEVDEYVVCKTYGNQNITIDWFVNENGNPSNFSNDFFIKAFDTTNFNLVY
ncbi:MAG: hypothetical protein HN704_05940 [Bacteroidetes bacterium]|jgi:hypothetical protein|nr:hypothetical protein [Bacteroidota bacterium]MBT6687296.1 hypothetical protein [Bacteroidota bacterium]MBT7143960.1 hypothetical protein [Bacteroidota bacterium]MBT7491127.1 hypothetical protein [Bacteroidota bacterium]